MTREEKKLPEGLEEAAERYAQFYEQDLSDENGNFVNGCGDLRVAFRAGTEYGMNQMFTITYDNEPLDSAARKTFEKWIPMEILEYNGFQMPLYNQGALIMMFEAGAKWMAGQGESHETEIVSRVTGNGLLPAVTCLVNKSYKEGDKVVVQIRKK